jgi:hypothetical protein
MEDLSFGFTSKDRYKFFDAVPHGTASEKTGELSKGKATGYARSKSDVLLSGSLLLGGAAASSREDIYHHQDKTADDGTTPAIES